jgi:hypothetical protein
MLLCLDVFENISYFIRTWMLINACYVQHRTSSSYWFRTEIAIHTIEIKLVLFRFHPVVILNQYKRWPLLDLYRKNSLELKFISLNKYTFLASWFLALSYVFNSAVKWNVLLAWVICPLKINVSACSRVVFQNCKQQ